MIEDKIEITPLNSEDRSEVISMVDQYILYRYGLAPIGPIVINESGEHTFPCILADNIKNHLPVCDSRSELKTNKPSQFFSRLERYLIQDLGNIYAIKEEYATKEDKRVIGFVIIQPTLPDDEAQPPAIKLAIAYPLLTSSNNIVEKIEDTFQKNVKAVSYETPVV
ncbi:hypothetical protein HYV79_01810 [Candidatus Woesearchaeota archaeon]|nr:hypothetical protein [Candidatus Woesearchaeota archaeon]